MKTHLENAARYESREKLFQVFGWICCALSILGVIGIVVLLVLIVNAEANQMLLSLLIFAALGVSVAGGCGALGFFRLGMNAQSVKRDYLERADGEESFFVGEDTLATFADGTLKLHMQGEKKKKTIHVPYSEIRFFSVCVRRKAKNTGEWCVLIEVPAKYLNKDKKAMNGKPALIQTDGKQRLYDCLKKHGLTLLGERVGEDANKKYTCVKRISMPDYATRRTKLLWLVFGVVVAIIGITLCIAVRDWTLIGAVIGALGMYVSIHSGFAAYRARTVLMIYEEGIYWRQSTITESTFIKWEEIVSVSVDEKERVLHLDCDYGEYGFPAADGVFAYIAERFPEKIK